MSSGGKKPFNWDEVQIGAALGSFEYVLTQAQVDNFRKSVDDPEADFPTVASKHDGMTASLVFAEGGPGSVNARNEVQYFNPPVPGKKIKVTGRIVDKYIRRDLPYFVIEATATDEDGRLIEKIRTYQLKRPETVGEKWSQQKK